MTLAVSWTEPCNRALVGDRLTDQAVLNIDRTALRHLTRGLVAQSTALRIHTQRLQLFQGRYYGRGYAGGIEARQDLAGKDR